MHCKQSDEYLLLSLPHPSRMDSFDNFQYDSSSSYGGLPIVDDTSSVVSGFTNNTQDGLASELSSLSLSSDSRDFSGRAQDDSVHALGKTAVVDEDMEGVLDDLKDEGSIELPPHACRCVLVSF